MLRNHLTLCPVYILIFHLPFLVFALACIHLDILSGTQFYSNSAQVFRHTCSDCKHCPALVTYLSTNPTVDPSCMHSTDHGFRWVPPCKDSVFVPSFPSLREELMRQHRQSNTNIFRCDAWRLAPISGTQMGIRLNFWNRNLVDHLIKCLSHHCLSRARKVGSSCLKESRVEMLTWSVFTCKSIARGPGNYVIVPDFRMWRTSNWEGGPRSKCWKTETWHTICTE